MTQLLVGVAGAAILGPAGFGLVSAGAGFLIGSTIGGMIGPGQHVQGSRLDPLSMRAPKLQYGARWPRVKGRIRTAGIHVWQSDLREVATNTEQGGKGGPSVTSTTFTYYRDVLIGLAGGYYPDGAITRVWVNAKLVWSNLADSSDATIDASASTVYWSDMRFYNGSPTQLPDPTYEAAVETANAQAFRHRATVFFESVNQGGFEQLPLIEVEFVSSVTFDAFEPLTRLQTAFANGGADISCFLLGTPSVTGAASIASGSLSNDTSIGGVATWESIYLAPLEATAMTFECLFSGSGVNGDPIGLDTQIAGYQWDIAVGGSRVRFSMNNSGSLIQFDTGASGIEASIAHPGGVVHLKVTYGSLGAIRATCNGVVFYSVAGGAGSGIISSGAAGRVTVGTDAYALSPPRNFNLNVSNLRVRFEETTNIGSIPAVESCGDLATPINPDLADVVREECEWNGLGASLIDVTDLVGYEVYGIACAGSARESIEFLMPAYHFQSVCTNVLDFVMLGGASAAAVAFADTGVGVDSANETPFVGPARDNDTEVAAKVALTYTNLNADYDNGTEQADRLVGVSNKVEAITLPLVWTEALAKGAVETLAARGRVETMGGRLQLSDKHAKLQPTDVITATDDEGTQFRIRIEETMFADGVYDHRYVRDDQAAIQRVGITNANYTPSIVVLGPGEAELVLIDGPILRDADNDPGFYAAVKGTGNYQGAVLFKSSDNAVFTPTTTFSDNAVIGTTTTALGDFTGGDVFDESTTVNVNMDNDTLSSSTRSAILLSQSVNAAVIGADGRWEVVQFRDAVLLLSQPNIYRLSGFLRGRRGTEHAISTHTATDKFVLLQTAGMRRVAMASEELAMTRYWKGVPLGRNVSAVASQTMSNDGVGLKPFSPVDLRAARDTSGNITFTWKRRTRLADRFGGTLGDSVPLGEASESYEIDIYTTSGYTTVVRTISATSQTASYTSGQQTTDGFSPGSTMYVKVYQMSAIVGRGYALQQAA